MRDDHVPHQEEYHMRRTPCVACYVLIFFVFSVYGVDYASGFKLPDTGQTKCYQTVSPYAEISCAGTGQDGAYSINPMSFTENGDGTVTDNNTLLIWQQQDNGNTYNWYKASGTYNASFNPGSESVCGSLTLAGHLDWRLPVQKELMTIVDYSIPSPGPAINLSYFPNTQPSWYWSFTTHAGSASSAWDIYFYSGYINNSLKTDNSYVRCVRGGQFSSPALVDNTDGTVADKRSGLMWQQGEPGYMVWSSALSYCEGLSLGGHYDWRLPNLKELASVMDDTRWMPAIDTGFFPGALSAPYWSSTTHATYSVYGWYVNSAAGDNYYDSKLYTHYVRCVRGGQGGSLVRLMHEGSPLNIYDWIQDAYNAAADGDIIQAQAIVSTETLTFASDFSVFLKGGYDSAFAVNTGMTILNGSLTISGGTVTMENFIIN
jgi:hypothetical protein